MKRFLFLVPFLYSLAASAQTPRNPQTGSLADVLNAINGNVVANGGRPGHGCGASDCGTTKAPAGTVITIPTGTWHWGGGGDDLTAVANPGSGPNGSNGTTLVNIANGITLQGAGTFGDTVIMDDYKQVNTTNFFTVTTAGGQTTRITNICFREGTGDSNGASLTRWPYQFQSLVKSNDTSDTVLTGTRFNLSGSLRVDHCEFNGLPGGAVGGNPPMRIESVWGVFDHCLIKSSVTASNTAAMLDMYDTSFQPLPTDGTRNAGFGSEISDSDYGRFRFNCYFEDCAFWRSGASPNGMVDGREGCRQVLRHCVFWDKSTSSENKSAINNHGTERRALGTRHIEMYDNIFLTPSAQTAINPRSGTGVFFNNLHINPKQSATGITMHYYSDRQADTTHWGRATGRNPWDINDTSAPVSNPSLTDPQTHIVFDGASHGTLPGESLNEHAKPFFIGYVAPSGNNGSDGKPSSVWHPIISTSPSLNVDPGWAPNQWRSFYIVNLTQTRDADDPQNPRALRADAAIGSDIEVSGSNFLDLQGASQGGGISTVPVWTPGTQIAIWRIKQGFNLPGRTGGGQAPGNQMQIGGQPTHILGTNPIDVINTEITESIYGWNNNVYTWDGANTYTLRARSIPFNPRTATQADNPAIHVCVIGVDTIDSNCNLVTQSVAARALTNPDPPVISPLFTSFYSATKNPGTDLGPDSDARSMIQNVWPAYFAAMPPPHDFGILGDATNSRHHPLVQPPVASISLPDTDTSFVINTAADCAANPPVNCHKVTTSGFASPATISFPGGVGAWSPAFPSPAPVFATPATPDGTATISGPVTNAVAGTTYTHAISATDGASTATQSFKLIPAAANAPTTALAISAPANGPHYRPNETIKLTATVTGGGTIKQVDFYDQNSPSPTVAIKTITTAPYEYSTTFSVGDYSFTARATNTANQTGPDSSPAINITVDNVTQPSPTPATIRVSP